MTLDLRTLASALALIVFFTHVNLNDAKLETSSIVQKTAQRDMPGSAHLLFC